jgi:hypothetical protein
VDFLSALSNVTEAKRLPDREEIEGLSWGIKRQLSMHRALLPVVAFLDRYYFALGDERFYEMLVHCCPRGQFRARAAKKEKLPEPPFDDKLRRRVCEVYGAKPGEFGTLLELLARAGQDAKAIKADFGVAPVSRTKAKAKKKVAKKAKRKKK